MASKVPERGLHSQPPKEKLAVEKERALTATRESSIVYDYRTVPRVCTHTGLTRQLERKLVPTTREGGRWRRKKESRVRRARGSARRSQEKNLPPKDRGVQTKPSGGGFSSSTGCPKGSADLTVEISHLWWDCWNIP